MPCRDEGILFTGSGNYPRPEDRNCENGCRIEDEIKNLQDILLTLFLRIGHWKLEEKLPSEVLTAYNKHKAGEGRLPDNEKILKDFIYFTKKTLEKAGKKAAIFQHEVDMIRDCEKNLQYEKIEPLEVRAEAKEKNEKLRELLDSAMRIITKNKLLKFLPTEIFISWNDSEVMNNSNNLARFLCSMITLILENGFMKKMDYDLYAWSQDHIDKDIVRRNTITEKKWLVETFNNLRTEFAFTDKQYRALVIKLKWKDYASKFDHVIMKTSDVDEIFAAIMNSLSIDQLEALRWASQMIRLESAVPASEPKQAAIGSAEHLEKFPETKETKDPLAKLKRALSSFKNWG